MYSALSALSPREVSARFAGASPVSSLTGLEALAALFFAARESGEKAAVTRQDFSPFAAREESEGSPDFEDARQAREGDGEAFRRLVERHQAQVAAMMWRFTRDPETHAALTQDVFVEAWISLGSYRPAAPFIHWLARIATRAGYRHWRRLERERERFAPLDGAPAAALAVCEPSELAPSEAAQLIERLLAGLPPRDRLVITLRFIEDRSVEETARLTGWSPSLVKVQTWRARRKLRRLFERFQKEPRHES